jgi:hypothetical protein
LLDHPRTVYLREATCYPPGRLAHRPVRLANLDATLDALIAASQDASGAAERCARVERTLADCQRKLAPLPSGAGRRGNDQRLSVQLTARQESIYDN